MIDNDDGSFFEEQEEDPVVNDDGDDGADEQEIPDDSDDQSVIPFIPEEVIEDESSHEPVVEEVTDNPIPKKARPTIEVVEEPLVVVENPPMADLVVADAPSKPSFFEWVWGLIPVGSKKPKLEDSPQDVVKAGPSYIERKFGNGSIVADVVPAPAKRVVPRPIPAPPTGLIERAKYKFTHYPAFAWLFYGEEELKRQEKTGLTPRQRIKRYNAIHEGGYGKPVGPEKGDEENGTVSETV